MGDSSAGSRSTSGNLGPPGSPLRIFTRITDNEHAADDPSPGLREPTSALLSSTYSRQPDDGSDHRSRPSSSHAPRTGKAVAAAAPRVGRPGGTHYHPLPSHWRGHESSPSSMGSPVTPDSGGSEDPSSQRLLPLVSSAGSQVAYAPEPFRAYHNSHSYNTVKTKQGSAAGHPYGQVGAMGEAFGSVSSLDWNNDRPSSTHSYRSTEQAGATRSNDQAESPLDYPGLGSRYPPALGALAARSGQAQRGVLGVHTGPSRHHPSASTSSSHYSYSMSSPPIRGPGATAQFLSPKDPSSPVPATTAGPPLAGAAGESPVPLQGEDIVRRYFGQQPKQPSQSPQAAKSFSPSSSTSDEATSSIVYRRAVSSGDLPTLEELHGAVQGGIGSSDSKTFLTHDLVESPLEALVRRLTIELFQLYVSEDRRKAGSGKGKDQAILGPDDEKDIAESLSRVLDPLSTDEGYVQQFRLGPSLRSGSTTPAVTMDGYFVPQAVSGNTVAEPGDVRPRPRHRLLERTWMEEALIKARRVSTIDENAEETILQGLAVEAGKSAAAADAAPPSLLSMATSVVDSLKASSPNEGTDVAQFGSPPAAAPRVVMRGSAGGLAGGGAGGDRVRARPKLGLPSLSEEGSEQSADDGAAHTMSPRGHYRARDPAAPHRKLPAERRNKSVAASSISPARASLLRAVGRRQSVRLQPGKGQIVVAETPTGSRSSAVVGNRNSIAAPVTLDPEAVARAKRTNSLPGIMQVPETKEVSYRDLQRKAARRVEVKKAARSRGRVGRRAERMVRGGTQTTGRSDGRRRHGHHRRAGSRADMEQQLVRVELPPPVPLRVRREQVRIAPEPLIIVRPPAMRVLADDVSTTEQKILRVQNQLLGAQAVLSRHNSVMRQAAARGTGSGSGTPAKEAAMAISPGKNTMRSQALDMMMLECTLDDRDDDEQRQRLAEANQRRRRERGDNGATHRAEMADTPARPWRNARRRSTLRRKERAQQEPKQQGSDRRTPPSDSAADAPTASRSPTSLVRQLLLHGPAFKIYSGLRARPDTYLFLFSDILVVAVRVGDAGVAVMTAPSVDINAVPASRYRVQLVIPLAPRITTLKAQREGASKRIGEDDDAEERRVVDQEERVRRACHLFEKNTSEAVLYLVKHDIIGINADTVAGFLHRCTALSRRQTGSFLGAGIMGENLHENSTSDEVEREKLFHQQTWIAYLDRCNIVGVPIDEALRSILLYFRLPQNRRSTGILLEIAALQWYVKNKEYGTVPGVYLPDSQDTAVKLVFAIMFLNSEAHNPMIREAQSEAVYHTFLNKFRASVVDDPALAGKRKGNVLRKRDQPRVVTIMEVPTDVLRAIYERVLGSRLVTCSDTYATAAEFDVDWVGEADAAALPLSDEQVERDIEDIYSDPGFRDGILFNASSDRLPAKFNIDPPAWVRVTVRIPEPDAKFALTVRVLAATADASAAEPISILPSPRLSFHASASASFVIRPQQVGYFTLHFVPEGARARYYHPIPPRSVIVEGAFMRQAVQVSWKRGDGHGNHGRHMFGLDSQSTKARWIQGLETALKATAAMSAKDILRSAEKATQALVPAPTDQTKTSDQSVSTAQLMGALGVA